MPVHNRPGFSLIELVIVVVIIGLVSAIAIPRMASATENSRAAALVANQALLTKAVEHYAAEHNGQHPGEDASGNVSTDSRSFMSRLIEHTDESGALEASGIFGPYLRSLPTNPYNDNAIIRIDGPASATGLAGWRFSSATRTFQPDHAETAQDPSVLPSGLPNFPKGTIRPGVEPNLGNVGGTGPVGAAQGAGPAPEE